jgi:hypothetical protein
MFFELRRYPLKPGKRDAWVKWMDEEIIPFQMSKGMVVLASFVDEENDTYVWIRRFESQEEKEVLYEAVYGSDYWKNDASPQVGDYIDRDGIEVTILTATPRSYMQ